MRHFGGVAGACHGSGAISPGTQRHRPRAAVPGQVTLPVLPKYAATGTLGVALQWRRRWLPPMLLRGGAGQGGVSGGSSIPSCSPPLLRARPGGLNPHFGPGWNVPAAGIGAGAAEQLPLNWAAKCFHVGSGCCSPQLPAAAGPAQPGWASAVTAAPATPQAGFPSAPGAGAAAGGDAAGSARPRTSA